MRYSGYHDKKRVHIMERKKVKISGNHNQKRLDILESLYCWDTKGVTAGRQSRADGH